MKTTSVVLTLGEETPIDLSKFKYCWLTTLVKDEETTIEKKKPSFPSEFDHNKKFTINHNYDGMIGSVIYNPETKTIKGSGYGWKTMTYNFE